MDLRKLEINGMAHITGGGFEENLRELIIISP